MAFKTSRGRASSESVASHLREALHCVLRGDLAAAEATLAQAARVDSSSSDLYLSLATLYRARGEIGRAIAVHQNLLLRQELPESLRREALLGLALDFRAGGFLRRAAASFRELLELEPRHLEALQELEQLSIQMSDWLEAIAIRRRIGSADPRSPTIRAHLWTGLMREQIRSERRSDAQRSFRRAVSSDRRCAEPYVVFGELRMQESRPRKAIHLWKRALSLHPHVGVVLFPRLWEAFEQDGDLEGFRELMTERRRERPEDREATLWWARASIRLGAVEPALEALRQLLHEHPDYFPAYGELGRALLRAGREGESAKAFEELLAHLPSVGPVLRCRACGSRDSTLHWRCPQCGQWDSFV